MSGYVHGATRPLAEQLARLQQEIVRLRKRIAVTQSEADFTAASTVAHANTEARRIITAAIDAADKIRHQSERASIATKALAENEANRIRENAYLEGRTRADAHQIETDKQQAGNRRRDMLANACRTNVPKP